MQVKNESEEKSEVACDITLACASVISTVIIITLLHVELMVLIE